MATPSPQFEHLFHGTGADIHDEVRAPALTGAYRPNIPSDDQRRGRAYGAMHNASASEHEDVAWKFAYMGAEDSRARVYKVGVPENAKPGVEHPEGPVHLQRPGSEIKNREWIAPVFPVKERIDIKPGHQGTFPQEDWANYVDNTRLPRTWAPGRTTDSDANHPSPERVHEEMKGHLERSYLQEKEHQERESWDEIDHLLAGTTPPVFHDRRPGGTQLELPFGGHR